MITVLGQRSRGHRMVNAAGGGAFAPSDLANLAVWLKADAGLYDATSGGSLATADGTGVGRWEDLRGNARHVVASNTVAVIKTNQINGLPLLRTNAQQFANATDFSGGDCTIFLVARMTPSTSQKARVLGGKTNNWLLGWHSTHMDQGFFTTTVKLDSTADDGTLRKYTGKVASGAGTLYYNGSSIGTAGSGCAGPNGFVVGGDQSFNENSLCDVAEVIIYTDAKSDANRNSVETYLARWF